MSDWDQIYQRSSGPKAKTLVGSLADMQPGDIVTFLSDGKFLTREASHIRKDGFTAAPLMDGELCLDKMQLVKGDKIYSVIRPRGKEISSVGEKARNRPEAPMKQKALECTPLDEKSEVQEAQPEKAVEKVVPVGEPSAPPDPPPEAPPRKRATRKRQPPPGLMEFLDDAYKL